jgi:CO/xanthine dehydrogenase Mo-binding subunit
MAIHVTASSSLHENENRYHLRIVAWSEHAHRALGAAGLKPGGARTAVVDALAHTGVREIDMPMTPDKVWDALNEAGLAE